jgi:PmbA protein
VHSVETKDEVVLGLRVLVGRSLGFVTANTTDRAHLRALAREVVDQARATPEDPLNDLPEPDEVRAVAGLYDPATADVRVEDTTRAAAALLERIRASDTRVRVDSGSVHIAESVTALASTTGVELAQRETTASGYVFGMAVDGEDVGSFDYDGDAARSFRELESLLEAAADRFVSKCTGCLGAGKGRSFKGDVVLSPEAVAEFLVPNLIGSVAADTIRKGKSRLIGRVGTTISSRGLTLVDDGTRSGGVASSAFDREGTPLRRNVIVDAGVLTTYLYNHYEARAAGDGRRSTAHATGSVASLPSIGPSFLEVLPGDVALDSLTAGAEPVLWLGRFSGSSNPVTGEFSGVAKNALLFEGGSARPVRETLVAGDLFEVLGRIVALSSERRLLDGARLLPAVRLSGVSVTAG